MSVVGHLHDTGHVHDARYLRDAGRLRIAGGPRIAGRVPGTAQPRDAGPSRQVRNRGPVRATGITESARHYRTPLVLVPYGCSTYRGIS